MGAAAAAAVVTVVVQCMDSLDGADTLEAVNDVETKFRLHCPEVSARASSVDTMNTEAKSTVRGQLRTTHLHRHQQSPSTISSGVWPGSRS